MKKNIKINQRGQTLIEVLATVLFIAIGVLSLIRFQNYLAYNNSLSQQKADAVILATNQIENLRSFHVLNNTAGYTSYQSIATSTTTSSGINTSYSIASTITAYTNPTYKRLDVIVSWTDRNNTSQSVELVSYVAGIEPGNSASVM